MKHRSNNNKSNLKHDFLPNKKMVSVMCFYKSFDW